MTNVVGGAFQPNLTRRVRPHDPLWPSESKWDELSREVAGRLFRLRRPLVSCQDSANGGSCDEIFRQLNNNPYFIGDQPELTQTSGWVDAWTSTPSVYAVAAKRTQDVVAAVNFARDNNLRLVIKGGGHSYQGTSNAGDSLLIWTRAMNKITLHDAFVGKRCERKQAPQPAVTVEAGAIWMHTYDAVTTKAGRYVQGGGCATVGVAGLIQSGGFGSFSKNYGLAAAGLLEAEIVTAEGAVRIANACFHPDLFWAIKGGGGGSLGVVTRVTLRTRDLPEYFGAVLATIKALSDTAFRELTTRIIDFYNDNLFNHYWGEQIVFGTGNTIRISMLFQGLNQQQAEDLWRPFFLWVSSSPEKFSTEKPAKIAAIPAQHFWDPKFMQKNFPGVLIADDRPASPEGNVFWAGDQDEAGHFVHGYRSVWLPAALLTEARRHSLVDALFKSSRHWEMALHFNKGLAGASPDDLAAARDTAMNPAVLDAFALAICAGDGPAAFPGIYGHAPDVIVARRHAREIDNSMDELLRVVSSPGSYVAESNFFERGWQNSFWGSNYPRLAAVKKKYDPRGLFFVRHGVGSEEWSEDGFERLANLQQG